MGSNAPQNWVAGNSHGDMFCTLNALIINKLYRLFLLILSYWEQLIGHFGTKLSFLLQTVKELDQIRRKTRRACAGYTHKSHLAGQPFVLGSST